MHRPRRSPGFTATTTLVSRRSHRTCWTTLVDSPNCTDAPDPTWAVRGRPPAQAQRSTATLSDRIPLPPRHALIDLSLHSAAMPTVCAAATYPPPRRHPMPRRRGVFWPSAMVHCRYLDNNAITAIPMGLLNFATALIRLYGRPRPNMGRGRPPRPSATASLLVPHMHCFPSRCALIDLFVHSAPMPTTCCRGPLCTTYPPPRRHQTPPPWYLFAIHRAHGTLQELERQRHYGDTDGPA